MADQVKDLLQNLAPIASQGIVNRVTGNSKPGDSLWDSSASAAGVTSKPNTSPAEQLAYRLGSERAATGPVPSEQLTKHHTMIGLEDRMRNGDPTAQQELQTKFAQGALSPDDVKSIQAGAQGTRLTGTVGRLPMSDVLDVWNLATNDERKRMLPTVVKKMAAFRKTEYQKLTPAERNQMDTRLAKVTPEMLDLNRSTEQDSQ